MMKKKLLVLALCCLMWLGLASPALAAVEELVDLRLDQVVAYSREDGIYTVMEDGAYGFYRADGSPLLAPAYAAAGDFHDGMAAVSSSGKRTEGAGGAPELLRDGRFGYVDSSGLLAVPMKYSRAFPFSGDRAFAVDAESGVLVLLDKAGREVASYPEADVPRDGTVRFSEGLAVIPVKAGEGAAYLVVDAGGQEVCTLTDALVDYSGGYHNGRIAVASQAGEQAESPADRTGSGLAWGYRDEAGELAIPFQYAQAAPFAGGLAAVKEAAEQGGYGLIAPDGGAVTAMSYDGAVTWEDGMGALLRDGRWAYVGRAGQTLTGFIYDEAAPFSSGVVLARSDGQVRAMDEQGRTLFSMDALGALPFSGGVAVVRQADGQCGICDMEGNLLVPFTYEDAFHYDGYLWLKRGNLWRVYRTEDVIQARREAPEAVGAVVGVFSDVPEDAWYAGAVTWATDHDIVTGTGGGLFSPDKLCTTGEIVTILWRAVGRPEAKAENPFTDVTPNHYYYQAALWAYENGMVEGGVFGAAEPCTRSMAVTYLWRLAGSPEGGTALFSDVPPQAEYAQAVAWAVAKGVTAGSGQGTFHPGGICSRGEIVTFLHRYLTEA